MPTGRRIGTRWPAGPASACDDPSLWVDPSAQIGRGVTFAGRNIVGAGAVLRDGAALTDSILWAGARVAPGEEVRGAILAPGLSLRTRPLSRLSRNHLSL